MPQDNTFIAPTTGTANKSLEIRNGQSRYLSASQLAGAETVDIETWEGNAYVATGEQLTASAPAKMLDGPGYYRLSKSATVASCGVYVTG